MQEVVKKEAMASSLDTEAAGQELKGSGYTIAATAHAVDTGIYGDVQDQQGSVLASGSEF